MPPAFFSYEVKRRQNGGTESEHSTGAGFEEIEDSEHGLLRGGNDEMKDLFVADVGPVFAISHEDGAEVN